MYPISSLKVSFVAINKNNVCTVICKYSVEGRNWYEDLREKMVGEQRLATRCLNSEDGARMIARTNERSYHTQCSQAYL